MGFRIQPGASTILLVRAFQETQRLQTQTLARLAAGQRLTSAAEGPAGFIRAEGLRAQASSLQRVLEGAERGVATVRIAEAGAGGVAEGLQRARELALQAREPLLGEEGRGLLQAQLEREVGAISRTAQGTRFGGQPLLAGGELRFQVGPEAGQGAEVELPELTPGALGLEGLNLATPEGREGALGAIEEAISRTAEARGRLGAFERNALESVERQIEAALEGVRGAEEEERGLDFPLEVARFASQRVRGQAGLALLTQANASAARTLTLLQVAL